MLNCYPPTSNELVLSSVTSIFGVSDYGGNIAYLAWAGKGLGKPGWKGGRVMSAV